MHINDKYFTACFQLFFKKSKKPKEPTTEFSVFSQCCIQFDSLHPNPVALWACVHL